MKASASTDHYFKLHVDTDGMRAVDTSSRVTERLSVVGCHDGLPLQLNSSRLLSLSDPKRLAAAVSMGSADTASTHSMS